MKNVSKVLMLVFLGSILFITSCSNSNDPTDKDDTTDKDENIEKDETTKDYEAFLNIVKGNTYVAEHAQYPKTTFKFEADGKTFTTSSSADGGEDGLTGVFVPNESSSTQGVYDIGSNEELPLSVYYGILYYEDGLYLIKSDVNNTIDWEDGTSFKLNPSTQP